MSITLHSIFKQSLQVFGILAFSSALIAPAAHAAPKKVVKKAHTAKVTVKKQDTARKRVTFVSGAKRKLLIVAAPVAARSSFGQIAGLHAAQDPLDLKSSVALVIDQDTQEVLFSKNDQAVLPIASLTKLMTGMIISGAHLPMDEVITITQDDVDTEKGSRSRLRVGSSLTRGELLHLALMSSENRSMQPMATRYCASCPPLPAIRWPSAGKPCNTTTPTGW